MVVCRYCVNSLLGKHLNVSMWTITWGTSKSVLVAMMTKTHTHTHTVPYRYSWAGSWSAGLCLEDFLFEQTEGESLEGEPSPSPADRAEGTRPATTHKHARLPFRQNVIDCATERETEIFACVCVTLLSSSWGEDSVEGSRYVMVAIKIYEIQKVVWYINS